MQLGMITAGHEKTAEAAAQVLQQGGNAFDAIVAAGFAACVAEPVFASLAGGGFLLAHTAAGKEQVYDFFVQTPKKVPHLEHLDFYPIQANFGPTTQEFHIGLGSMATPGMVAGMFAIHQDLGRLPIAQVVAPAIQFAREGVAINKFQQYLFTVVGPIYSATPEAQKLYGSQTKPGKLVQAGEVLKFPDLALTLEALAKEGPQLFYQGELAKRLVQVLEKGGALGLEDLAGYEVHRRKPLEFSYRGHHLWTNPPLSCGGILIALTLHLLDQTSVFPHGSLEDLQNLAHAMELTNQARLDALTQAKDWEHACQLLVEKDFLKIYAEKIQPRPKAVRGTTHLNVIDAQGNVASMSLSNGEGCGHLLPGTDIMLNNMLGEEDLNPAGFHQWQTDQRMASMMSPTLLFTSDGAMVAMGSGGSNRIRTAIVQVIKNLTDHQHSVAQAVEAPRIHYERGLLSVEPGFDSSIVKTLCQEFSQHRLWEEKNLFFGGVHVLRYHPTQGFEGRGDPRRFGVCVKV